MSHVKDLWAADPARKGSKGKRWLAVWQDPAGATKTKAFATKDAATKFGRAQETDAARGDYADPKARKITVGEWCDTWLAGYGSRKPSTVRQARTHIVKIKAEFGDMRVSAVRPSMVKSWTARLRAGETAASYVYALHRRLAKIFADAVQDGILPRSPCSRDTSPGAGRQVPYVATTQQVWQLHDAMPARYRPAVLLGAFAGLRIAETCGLRVSDVDFMRDAIRPVVQYPAEELKTECSRATVPLAHSVTLLLSAHVAGWPSAWVLAGPGGGQLEPWRLERAFRTARARVPGLPPGFRYHDLRHYFASLLIAAGCDVKTVQARLRHGSATTTLNTYAHMWPDRDESTRAAVEAAVAQRPAEQSRNKIANG